MPRVAVMLETAAFERYGLPIITIAEYDILSDVDAAGTWALSFPVHEDVANSIRTRHRITVIEEGLNRPLLRRGIITDRQFAVGADKQGTLRLAGFSRLFALAAESTHLGLSFSGVSILDIAEALTGEHVIVSSVPGITLLKPGKVFDDASKLDALLQALKDCRLSIRETLDGDYELVPWDAVPDSGYRFVTADRAGAALQDAAAGGFGIIAGTPTIGYNGRELATRVIPIGVDFNGDPLTLQYATLSAPYAIQSALNPNGSTYWYLQDANAVARHELIEVHLERSDIKVPNDNPTDRAAAANALYTAGVGELLMRRSDAIAFSGEIANGNQVEATPGDRARIQFKGVARGYNGADDFWAFDKHFRIGKRRDFSSGGAGVRQVSFTLTAPEVPLRIPSLPDVVPIPPPPTEPPDPPWEELGDPLDDVSPDEVTDEPLPAQEDFQIPYVPPQLMAPSTPKNPYPECCGSPTTTTHDTPPPPEDIEDGDDPFLANRCRVPWEAAAVQTFRFVDKWGGIWADPGIGFPNFIPGRDQGIAVLVSSSAPPVMNVTGAQATTLFVGDFSTPANFGGDGHTWYRISRLDITDEVVDFAGTTGAFREVTWMRASEEYQSVEVVAREDDEYATGFGVAHAHLDVSQNILRDDLVWFWFDEVYRSIDNMDFVKVFHHETRSILDYDWALHNAEFVTFTPGGGAASATSWLTNDDKPNSFVHAITMQYDEEANATDFPGACRVFAIAMSVRMRATCKEHLIVA